MLIVLLLSCCVVGLLMTAVRLPGTWLIVAAALGFGWWTGWQGMGLVSCSLLVVIALIGEAVELLSSVFLSRRAGATPQAGWGGLVGGVLGMLFLSFLVPVPLVGTMIGAVLGCFGGAMLVEFSVRRKLVHGTKVGVFAAWGLVLGTVAKLAIALVMSALVFTSVVCSRSPDASRVDAFDLVIFEQPPT